LLKRFINVFTGRFIEGVEMRLLHISDIHQGDVSQLKKIVKKEKPDLVVFTGDVGIFDYGIEDIKSVKPILNELNSLGVKVLVIPGNHDEAKDNPVFRKFIKKYNNLIDLHAGIYEQDGYIFVGFGHSERTAIERLCLGCISPVTPGVFEPADAEKTLKKVLKGLNTKKTILLTHIPPMTEGITDFNMYGYHNGSVAIANVLREVPVLLNLCGDIHEARGMESFGKTLVVNSGSFGEEGSYSVIDLGKKVKVDMRG